MAPSRGLFFFLLLLAFTEARAYGFSYDSYGYSNYGYSSGYYSGSRSKGPIVSLELDDKKRRELDLRIAARESRIADLTRLIAEGVDVNGKSDEGETALHDSARVCALDSVKELLHGGARVNQRDARGRTALMYAVMEGCLTVTRQLLKAPRISLGVRDEDHYSVLDYAEQATSLDVDGPAVEILNLIRKAWLRNPQKRHRSR